MISETLYFLWSNDAIKSETYLVKNIITQKYIQNY